MHFDSLILKRVEYKTSMVESGFGLVVSHAQESGKVVVVDEDDGTRWTGYEEHVTVIVN